jgi:3-methyl-2-oxobutanoate hydroxymethyltransferase
MIMNAKKLTVPSFKSRKGQEKLVLLTAYSAPMARLLAPHVDALLVGDSVGMVYHGLPSTLPVTLEMMSLHATAVRRGAPDSFVIVDLPFGSYQISKEQAFSSAAELLKTTGADAVKLEGGVEMADTVRFLTERGVPVMGHIGLMPQRINQMGHYHAQGRTNEAAARIHEDATALEQAGAFSIVIEGVLESIASDITGRLSVPTIGIGASPSCDGQILVTDDMLGLFSDFTPKFVRKYANLSDSISKAVSEYAQDVRNGKFPSAAECFK